MYISFCTTNVRADLQEPGVAVRCQVLVLSRVAQVCGCCCCSVSDWQVMPWTSGGRALGQCATGACSDSARCDVMWCLPGVIWAMDARRVASPLLRTTRLNTPDCWLSPLGPVYTGRRFCRRPDERTQFFKYNWPHQRFLDFSGISHFVQELRPLQG